MDHTSSLTALRLSAGRLLGISAAVLALAVAPAAFAQTAPSAPTNVSVTLPATPTSPPSIEVMWDDPADFGDDGGGAGSGQFDHYEYSLDGGATWATFINPPAGGATPGAITGGATGVTSTINVTLDGSELTDDILIRVVSLSPPPNDEGASSTAATGLPITLSYATDPADPTGAAGTTTPGVIDATWTAPAAGAEGMGHDGTTAATISGYEVIVDPNAVPTWPPVPTVTTATASYSATGLAAGSYYVHIRTVNSAGRASGGVVFGPITVLPAANPAASAPALGNTGMLLISLLLAAVGMVYVMRRRT